MITNHVAGGLLLGAAMYFIHPAQAKDDQADVVFHGTLIEPPLCSINNGQQIDVNFGEKVGVNKVDGINYRTPLNYQVSCEGNTNNTSAVLKLSLGGTVSTFDTAALSTNVTNLGIRIYYNDRTFTPNTALNIDLTNPPVLEAVPIKKQGTTLTEGTFDAWATLRAEYE